MPLSTMEKFSYFRLLTMTGDFIQYVMIRAMKN